MTRRKFVALSSLLPTMLAGGEGHLPANRNVTWALSSALWNSLPPSSFTDILDVMQATGFIGIRLTGFPRVLEKYGLTAAQLQRELAKRSLHVATISWGGPLQDPAQRAAVLESAREAMRFLADFGSNHLVVFSPKRPTQGANSQETFRELCTRCNQIGELAREMGFTVGLHNHLGEMVQTQDEIDLFMTMTDASLFGLSPDTAHLYLAGCDVVSTLQKHRHRIHFLDYKDARWTSPSVDWIQPNGEVLPRDSASARFYASIYDLGDGNVDFPACHRILKSVDFRGWICVDLDTARAGPVADFRRCGEYIARRLEPIYR
jgi:sugar phosphate isomerase/epimerase